MMISLAMHRHPPDSRSGKAQCNFAEFKLTQNNMHLAVNKQNKNDFHAFTWTHDSRLIVNGIEVSPNDWDIIEVRECRPRMPILGGDSYPVFIMFEALYKRKFLDFNKGLDRVWEHCTYEYFMFQGSQFNREEQSEYDCIYEYVRNLGEPLLTGYNGRPCETTL